VYLVPLPTCFLPAPTRRLLITFVGIWIYIQRRKKLKIRSSSTLRWVRRLDYCWTGSDTCQMD
jgi:hypothetical protein